jgi:peptidoglycan L-alanyl-D-glutamate endopeptidase CwlK
MGTFGATSKKHLSEAHPLLQELFEEVIKHYDCAIIEGFRSEDEQNKAFFAGKSKLKFPNSKHNKNPSLAVDAVPYPIDWNDNKRFYYFGGFVMATAKQLGIDVAWGGDWNGNNSFKDQVFHDLPHFELRSTQRLNATNKGGHLPTGPSEKDMSASLSEIDKELGLK